MFKKKIACTTWFYISVWRSVYTKTKWKSDRPLLTWAGCAVNHAAESSLVYLLKNNVDPECSDFLTSLGCQGHMMTSGL